MVPQPRNRLPLRAGVVIAAVIACVLLLGWLKVAGFILVVLIGGAAWLYVKHEPSSHEIRALRSSIELSLDDLNDVIAEYDEFVHSQNPDALADRTLHRPALLDRDCSDPDIERFHYEYSAAQRFKNRMSAHLANTQLDVSQLDNLLTVTDKRAATLRDAWLEARRSAQRLGADNSS